MSTEIKKLWVSMGLHFAAVASIMLCRTYVDLLFLSTYPKSWLPFYFMGQTVATLVLTYIITPQISKGSRLRIFLNLVICSLTLVAAIFLMDLEIDYFPFALCLWLAAFSVLLGVISWNCVGDAFDARAFKRIILWINVAGSVGGLVVGLLIPSIIYWYSADMLLYILIVLTLVQGCLVYMLEPLPASSRKMKGGQSPMNYTLFKSLAVGVFLLFVVDTFADYALKAEVGAAYTKEGIGKFMGPFYGLSSVLILAVQFGGTNHLIKYFGIAGLLAVLPGFCLLVNLGMIAYPGLWVAAAFRMGEMVFRYSVDNIGRELAANPLPSPIRKAGKLFLKGVVTPIGSGAGAVVLWLLAETFGLRGIAFATVAVSGFWMLANRQTRNAYQSTLEETVKQKRFIADMDGDDPASREASMGVALQALGEKDPDSIRFGLALLEDIKFDKIPQPALEHLNSEHPDIRASVLKLAMRVQDTGIVPRLVKQLEAEREPEVVWRLLDALAAIDPASASPFAEKLLKSQDAEIRASAILVLMLAGSLSLLAEAVNSLKDMVFSSDPLMRKGAARAMGALKGGKLGQELRLLIHDPSEDVCITTIRSASQRQSLCLIEDIASKLGRGRTSHYASRALAELGVATVPHLLKAARQGKERTIRAAIKTMAMIPGEEVEDALAEVACSEMPLTRNIVAKESALRAGRMPVSKAFRKKAIGFVEEEAGAIRILKSGRTLDSLSGFVKSELSCRLGLAQTRLLHWFAVCTRPAEVMGVMPLVLSGERSKDTAARRGAAMELLDTLASDKRLKNSILEFEKEARANGNAEKLMEELKNLNDPWLRRVLSDEFHEYKGVPMNIAQKVMAFKKVKLFESLPGEILMTIAEESETREMIKGAKIVSTGEASDGLYIIASGTVRIEINGQPVRTLGESDFFGEVGLLDDSARAADAVANEDGLLFFIGKETFGAITEDLPEVMRAVVKTIIGYLKKK
ncbi:MAG: HEAT repeat domain-containing protein [Nitrospinae bacterium]|nr:HEAT repeat domain-containing protein [Nitrospinota bacterium]